MVEAIKSKRTETTKLAIFPFVKWHNPRMVKVTPPKFKLDLFFFGNKHFVLVL